MIIYDGHSTSEELLDIDRIEKLRDFKVNIPMERYQMLYLNACSSYSTYLEPALKLKKSAKDPQGSKYLDVMSVGLYTYFDNGYVNNLILIEAVHDWLDRQKAMSYQTLASKLDKEDLFVIAGDEDNEPESSAR